MLEVCMVISGALVLFVVLTLWANSDRFKSDSETDHG
jgi:hypothetical protein